MSVQTIPLQDLQYGDAWNARPVAERRTGIEELADSISSFGVLQSLLVGPGNAVAAGNRRLAALQLLCSRGDIEPDFPVPVIVYQRADDLMRAASIAENIHRVQMHPVSEYEAFAGLADGGMPLADIAVMFGKPERTIKQRLALGRLSPVVRTAWREGKLEADQAAAFTYCGDHNEQAKYLKEIIGKNSYYIPSATSIKRQFVEFKASASRSELWAIPGVEAAYIAAGGVVDEDLFDDDKIIRNMDLMNTVSREIIERRLEEERANGWAWVAFEDDHSETWRNEPVEVQDTDEIIQLLDRQEKEEDGDLWQALEAQIEAAREAIREEQYSGRKSQFGALLQLDPDHPEVLYFSRYITGPDPTEPDDGAAGYDGDTEEESAPAAASPAASEPEASPFDLKGKAAEVLIDAAGGAVQRIFAKRPEIGCAAILLSLAEHGDIAGRFSLGRMGQSRDTLPGDAKLLKSLQETDEPDVDVANVVTLAPAQVRKTLAALAGSRVARISTIESGIIPEGLELLLSQATAEERIEALRSALSLPFYFEAMPKATAEAVIKELGGEVPKSGPKDQFTARAVNLAEAHGWIPPQLRCIVSAKED